MKWPILLCLAFPSAVLLGQTLRPDGGSVPAINAFVDRVERLSRSFLPEMGAPEDAWNQARTSRRYCVYLSPDKGSLTIKRCQTTPSRLRLITLQKNGAPASRP